VRAAFERPTREARGASSAPLDEDPIAATLAAVDRDLMIVEEDPAPDGAGRPAARAPQARRLEYRQLFSTLRRG
jgi:hypothetical protein